MHATHKREKEYRKLWALKDMRSGVTVLQVVELLKGSTMVQSKVKIILNKTFGVRKSFGVTFIQNQQSFLRFAVTPVMKLGDNLNFAIQPVLSL